MTDDFIDFLSWPLGGLSPTSHERDATSSWPSLICPIMCEQWPAYMWKANVQILRLFPTTNVLQFNPIGRRRFIIWWRAYITTPNWKTKSPHQLLECSLRWEIKSTFIPNGTKAVCRLWSEFPSSSENSVTAEFLKNGWVLALGWSASLEW